MGKESTVYLQGPKQGEQAAHAKESNSPKAFRVGVVVCVPVLEKEFSSIAR